MKTLAPTFAALLGSLALAGCASSPTKPTPYTTIRVDPSSLAHATPVLPDAEWQVRIPLGLEAASDHTCRLNDQYELIEIRTPAKWQAFCRQTGLDCEGPQPDFSQGLVVGLVASVGEPADGVWPTMIRELRLHENGSAWLRGKFRTGLYRPVLVDPYCNLFYVKNLRKIVLVEINRRAYLTSQ